MTNLRAAVDAVLMPGLSWMMIGAILLLLVMTLLTWSMASADIWSRERRLQRYWKRDCTGRLWRRRFPGASRHRIRDFLTLFVDSFDFPHSRRLCFSPEDKVSDVYRAIYPPRKYALIPQMDAMEWETFTEFILDYYNIDLSKSEEDFTLGDLFDMVITPKLCTPPPRRAGI